MRGNAICLFLPRLSRGGGAILAVCNIMMLAQLRFFIAGREVEEWESMDVVKTLQIKPPPPPPAPPAPVPYFSLSHLPTPHFICESPLPPFV